MAQNTISSVVCLKQDIGLKKKQMGNECSTVACSARPLIKSLHIAEVRPERHREVAATTRAR
jgi:hypothetical protein